jgi:hypothetical protein
MLDSLDFSMLTPLDAFDMNSLSDSMVEHTRRVTCGPMSGSYLAPVTGSPVAYSQPYDQDYHDYYQQSHSFEHVTTTSATHPNMGTAGQGYAGDHEDDYMQYQHQQQAYQHSYWDSGHRGGGRWFSSPGMAFLNFVFSRHLIAQAAQRCASTGSFGMWYWLGLIIPWGEWHTTCLDTRVYLGHLLVDLLGSI